MNVTAYDWLIHDPYAAVCPNTGVKFEGSVVLFACDPTYTYSSTTQSGLETAAYRLTDHGGLYFDGKYLWQ